MLIADIAIIAKVLKKFLSMKVQSWNPVIVNFFCSFLSASKQIIIFVWSYSVNTIILKKIIFIPNLLWYVLWCRCQHVYTCIVNFWRKVWYEVGSKNMADVSIVICTVAIILCLICLCIIAVVGIKVLKVLNQMFPWILYQTTCSFLGRRVFMFYGGILIIVYWQYLYFSNKKLAVLKSAIAILACAYNKKTKHICSKISSCCICFQPDQ